MSLLFDARRWVRTLARRAHGARVTDKTGKTIINRGKCPRAWERENQGAKQGYRGPPSKERRWRSLVGKNWVSVPGRWESRAKALRYEHPGECSRACRETCVRGRGLSKGECGLLWACFPLYVRKAMDVPPGSPQSSPGAGPVCPRRSPGGGGAWEGLRRPGPNCCHVTLALSPSPSLPGADSKIRAVPDSLLQ